MSSDDEKSLDSSRSCGSALGTDPPHPAQHSPAVTKRDLLIGLTLAYSPSRKLSLVHRRKYRVDSWGQLKPRQQVEVMRDDLASKVYPHIDMAESHFEFHKSGEIHCHSILVLLDGSKHATWELKTFQKALNFEYKVHGKAAVRMTHSFIVTDTEHWFRYCRKSDAEMPVRADYKNINTFLRYL